MPIRFGSFELDEQRFELRRDGVLLNVQPRVLETLVFLARHSGRLVTKEELIAGPWKGSLVSDTALSQAIRQARAALGEDRGTPRFIETVRGKGFRFHADCVDPGEPIAEPPPSPRVRPFFGRERELERLRTAAHEARAEQGNIVLLHGPAGVGKTRLAQWFTTIEREQGAESCWSGCREGQSAPPFWPWPEVLHRYAESRDSETIEELARGMQADLVAIAPELREALGVASGEGRDESPERAASVLDSTARFLRRASSKSPLILVLEDLHLADDAALQLLEVVARSIADTRLLIIGTCRSTEGQERPVLKAALEGSLPHVHQMQLGGLSLETVREWLTSASRAPVPDEVVAALHYSTEGLPLLLENLVEALPQDWPTRNDAGASAGGFELPARIRQVLQRRLSQVDSAVLTLLRTAAVFGEEFPVSTLTSATAEAPATVLSTLHAAERLGLLKPANRGQMRFAHALHRDLLYNELSLAERHEHHARIGRAFASQLQHRPELAVQAAHHFLEAAPSIDVTEVVTHARCAATWARSRHAYARSAHYYQRALELLELSSGDPRAVCELLLELGQAHFVAGQVEQSVAALDRAFEQSRSQGFQDLSCRALLGYFQVRRESLAVDEQFHRRIAEVFATLTERNAVYAQLLVARAMATVLTSPVAKRVAWLEEALDLTDATVDARARLEVLRGALRCNTNFNAGTTLLGLCDEMIRLARTLGSPESELEAQQWRAHALLELGRGADFSQQCAQHLQQVAILRIRSGEWSAGILRGAQYFLAGRLREAERQARESGAIGQKLLGVGAIAYMIAQLFPVALEIGSSDGGKLLEELRGYCEEILAVAPNHQLMMVARAIPRLFQGEEGDARRCLALVGSSDDGLPDRLDRNSTCVLILMAILACLLPDVTAAKKVLRALRGHRGLHGVSAVGGSYLGPVNYWLGRLSLTVGRRSDALAYFQQAVEESRQARSSTYLAWANFYLAQMLPPSESHQRQALLAEAEKAAEEHGMHLLRVGLESDVLRPLVN